MKKHLKRIAMPSSWPLPRKTTYWVTKPSPGPHQMNRSLPLLSIIRDVLHLCDTGTEGRMIIGGRNILVDGKVTTDAKRGVGLMDTLSISKTNTHYRMLINKRGKLTLTNIAENDAKWKLCRIENKTAVSKGRIQINLHDGRNILSDTIYKTGDVLKIKLPTNEVISHYPLTKDSKAIIIGGSHVGEIGVIESINITRSSKPNIVRFREGFSITKDYVFVVGDEIVPPELAI